MPDGYPTFHQSMDFFSPAVPGYPNRHIFRFFSTIGTLMHLAGCCVYGDTLKIRFYEMSLKDCFKYTHLISLAKAAVNCMPWTISSRKLPPWRPPSDNPQHPIQCCTVITFCQASAFSFLWMFCWQHISEPIPLTFCEFISFYSHAPSLYDHLPLCNFIFSNNA